KNNSDLLSNMTGGGCTCCSSKCTPLSSLNRRTFMAGLGTAAAGTVYASASENSGRWKEPGRFTSSAGSLVVQPVLVYSHSTRKEGTSWRHWGSIQSDQDAAEEKTRITEELKELNSGADFSMTINPVVTVKDGQDEKTRDITSREYDVLLMFAAGGWVNTLESLVKPEKQTIVFIRHRSGPVYLWYEIISNRFLRKTADEYGQPGVNTRDVVVDDYSKVLLRLRAVNGLKKTYGKKVLCIGGAAGWGDGGLKAPQMTRKHFGMELINITYDELGLRLEQAYNNALLVKWCREQGDKLQKDSGISLETDKDFIWKSFLLTEVFHQLLQEHQTDTLTINQCMGTIMNVSGTTACLALSFLNDAGFPAFCESDFVVIPSGILLHNISGKPVFLNDPTWAHDGIVTLAHCTAPRRMNGKDLEDARILTHFESDWGAAPKVEMKVGQKLTVIDPDFNFREWLGFTAEIEGNPFLDICRSQIDIAFSCDTDELNQRTKGFHWMACYGDYTKELEYALDKTGISWEKLG
ncbi:MAG: sugar isomerase, partial [Acidobacteriota bacterium]